MFDPRSKNAFFTGVDKASVGMKQLAQQVHTLVTKATAA